jgi:predicted nucleotidyltransferase
MAAPVITDPKLVIPTREDFEKLLKAKFSYEAKQNTPEKDTWNKDRAHWHYVPWGIAYKVSIGKYKKAVASKNAGKRVTPKQNYDVALRYFIVAVAIDYKDLVDQLKRALKNWGFTSKDIQNIYKNVWQPEAQYIANLCDSVTITELAEQIKRNTGIELNEAVEKHETLNSKLFTKEEVLKDRVRDKMLEIVDEFLADLKEQEIKIKVDDILFIGSNASYNYTKDSDIDLHILANTKATKYDKDIADALYSAYRSLFNKNLDIEFFNIPVEIFVETEDSARVSNGIYSVKKNKWIKKPVQEDIPEYDTNALNELVDKWEAKCKELIDDIKADKLKDEKRVVSILEDIYDKLRKKGISKGEYSIENLAFKELRNKGYLDQLKDYRNDLVSKRLSLEEKLDRQLRVDVYNQIARTAGTQPIIQDNGMFFIYNIKASEINSKVAALRKLPCVAEVHANDNGKYDFSNTLEIAMNKMPSKYYNIRGKINI